MAYKAPGKHYRKGISTKQFYRMFPDDATAEQWFVEQRWPDGITCPRCGSDNVQTTTAHKTMPYRCRKSKKAGTCGRYFSAKTNTFMERANVGYQDWLYSFYLVATNLKGVSSMKIHREIGVTQKTAWYLAHRIRKAWDAGAENLFSGPIECDETWVGGFRKNMPASKRKALTGRGPVGKVPVAGIRDRATNKVKAQVVPDTTSETLGDFIKSNVIPGTTIYTDDATAYTHLPNHASVKHSVREYVRGEVHTNGIESFWAVLKRAHKGTFHRLSAKHLHRYVDEFVGRHNMRELDTIDQMAQIARKMKGAQLRYKDLIAIEG